MTADPYAPPQARLDRTALDQELPQGIRWMVMSGVAAAAITCAINIYGLMGAIVVIRNVGARLQPVYLAYDLCHMLVVAGLAYGTYRGSRTCAVLAFVTSILTHGIGIMLSRGAMAIAWVLAVALIGGYLIGMIGTLRWHAWRASRAASTAA